MSENKSLESGLHTQFIPSCTQSHRPSGRDPSVEALVPQVVQLGAGLVQVHVQVHVHHSSQGALLEVCRNLVEGLAPCLRHPEECEDEEEEEECREDQEDVCPTKFLGKDGIGLNEKEWIFAENARAVGYSTCIEGGLYSQQHIGSTCR